MALFSPTEYVRRVQDITPEHLHALGIRGILLDVDNTLSPHDAPNPEPEALQWLNAVKESGIEVVIVSNNSPERVAPFAKKLGLNFEAKAAKPLPIGFLRARKRMQCPKKALAVVGDQIFTDMIGANLAGMVGLLVQPIEPEKMLRFRIKRALEKPILAHYCKKHHQQGFTR